MALTIKHLKEYLERCPEDMIIVDYENRDFVHIIINMDEDHQRLKDGKNIALGGLCKTHKNKMEYSFFDRLLIEAQELAIKTNALNDFMRTQKFVELDRQNKDLLYKQSRLMNEYLQILGQRIELLGEKFSFSM